MVLPQGVADLDNLGVCYSIAVEVLIVTRILAIPIINLEDKLGELVRS